MQTFITNILQRTRTENRKMTRGKPNNRSKEEILATMLSAVEGSPSMKKTLIMYRSALSYAQLRRFLQTAEDRKLLARTGNGEYGITSRGIEYLKAYRIMQKVFDSTEKQGPVLAMPLT